MTTETIEFKELPVESLVENENNPNRMKDREFDLLVENIEQAGFTEPIVVRPLEDGRYQIVGGHHRYKAVSYLGWETVMCAVNTDPNFDQEMADMQMVRHNVIKGQMDPNAFIELYQQYASKYGDAILQEMFGFADEKEFQKLIKQTKKDLPEDMKDKFEQGAKEVKTIDGLAKLLNELFTKYGETTPYAFMVFDYGGKQSFWLRIEKKTYQAARDIGHRCIDYEVTMDDVMGEVFRRLVKEHPEWLEEIMAKQPKVQVPEGLKHAPTKEKIEEQLQL